MYLKLYKDFLDFIKFFSGYLRYKIVVSSVFFEARKNALVKLFMMKRGRYNRPFLHLAVISVLIIGVVLAPFISHTYPVFSQEGLETGIEAETEAQSIIVGEDVFQTNISQKPRDKVITYKVQKGDTISTIARKFGISTDTIKWENDLTGDNITVGDELRILPVAGMSHKVASGDTVYTIAKRYDTEPQKIVDFPFNDFANPETFSLVVGQILVVPDGIKPAERPSVPRRQFIATGPSVVGASGFAWPVRGAVSQFASWYHMAVDITAPVGTPVVAAQSGIVGKVNVGTYDGGYGTNVYVNGASGLGSHYAHMSGVNVSPGQQVVGGRTVIGWVGLTGRTTGSHLHFEILSGGGLVNPLAYLQ